VIIARADRVTRRLERAGGVSQGFGDHVVGATSTDSANRSVDRQVKVDVSRASGGPVSSARGELPPSETEFAIFRSAVCPEDLAKDIATESIAAIVAGRARPRAEDLGPPLARARRP